MGCRNRAESFEEDHSGASSLSEALLLTTMCIIGLPVDVHVKDGSVYSGIFHTASVDSDYGIVLKKARMTKKGKGKTNVGKEDLVDTLVVLSCDLVQVVAKEVMLPTKSFGGNITSDDGETVMHDICSRESPTCEVENHMKSLTDVKHVNQSRTPVQNENGFTHCLPPSTAAIDFERNKLPVNQMRTSTEVDCGKTDKTNIGEIEAYSGSSINCRQAGDDNSKRNAGDFREKPEFVKGKLDEKNQVIKSTHETNTHLAQVEAVENRSYMASNASDNGFYRTNGNASVKADDRCSERSTITNSAPMSSAQGIDLILESHNMPEKSVEISAPKGTDSTRNTKEFKLNPAAKIFSPSFVNPISTTASMPISANMVYVPNSSPVVHAAAVQPETGLSTFASLPSMPVKVAQYSNLTVGNGGSGSQFSPPIVGQLAHNRAQPLRYGAHYPPVLSEHAYLQPSSPAVMVGRSGQLVYVHSVSHDLVHGGTAISSISARPMLNHVQYPKQQGASVGQPIPICVPPPILTNAPQPFALQSHIPLLQPGFPVTRPVSVPGPNGYYGAKFS
ncbi:hypothetical protein HN51_000139 [Arachis hypogaea]|uniref:Ataxin 2 SM domain-containing protein n=2 Tax=Arachis TaxID=3817 RepID=A0A445EX11_ARAHY|nr:uncharacterized protein LOC107480281 isoform X1 [Arachis duranensis]XP_025687765.1 uncharacterized protein LOC112789873 isoform X1 [Arachis hypogaea]QHO47949.1 Polyadenylate-binding protein-interacting protein [Arachis hypogaea]RYR79957.1 hypothetical protein Ahy_A01g004751 [Arachis hypogaea]